MLVAHCVVFKMPVCLRGRWLGLRTLTTISQYLYVVYFADDGSHPFLHEVLQSVQLHGVVLWLTVVSVCSVAKAVVMTRSKTRMPSAVTWMKLLKLGS